MTDPDWLASSPIKAKVAFEAFRSMPLGQAVEFSRKCRDFFAAAHGAAQQQRLTNHLKKAPHAPD